MTIANVTANIAHVPDYLVEDNLGGYAPSYIRAMAAYARQAKLSLFATSEASQQERAGLQPQLEATVIYPHALAQLRGTFFMRAQTLPPDVAEVEFTLSGQDLDDSPIASARSTPTGWIAKWDTRDVGDGSYHLTAEATTTSGETYTSPYVQVFVDNH